MRTFILIPGQNVEIFSDFWNETRSQGKATLIRPCESKLLDNPYILDNHKYIQVEMWIVKMADGFTTMRKIKVDKKKKHKTIFPELLLY